MYYTLFNKNELIGVFDNKDKVENMINGLIQNKFSIKSNLHYKIFYENSICENKDEKIKNTNLKLNLDNNVKSKLSLEEEIKLNKKKSEIDYEVNKLKKEKERISESKKTYEVDLVLYERFKKIKSDDINFEIPDLFSEKYKVFEFIDKENKLNWENFYANYEQKNLSSKYNQMFSTDDAKSINL